MKSKIQISTHTITTDITCLLGGVDIDPGTARKIVEDSYVDDNLSGGNEEEADRMIGECQEIDGKFVYNGTVSQILSQGHHQVW